MFKNSFFSTLRIEAESSFITVDNCRMLHARGNFGDAVYVQKSHDVKFTNCVAEDYTRIGFVTDLGVHNVSYSQCFASNGHHASVMFGGAESNAGFWSEQSENVTFSQCLAENNTHIGFVAVPGGDAPSLSNRAAFIFQSCTASATEIGFVSGTYWKERPAAVTIEGCVSMNNARGFYLTAANSEDSFHISNTQVMMAFDGSSDRAGYLIVAQGGDAAPSFHLRNCVINCDSRDEARIASNDYLSGDILLYDCGKAVITLEHVNNNGVYNNHRAPAVIKSFTASRPDLRISNCNVGIPYMAAYTNVTLQRCLIAYTGLTLGHTQAVENVTIQDCDIVVPVFVQTDGRVQFRSTTLKLSPASQLVVRRPASTGSGVTEFIQCRVEKNVTSDAQEAIKLEDQGAGGSNVWFQQCMFNNPDGAAGIQPFISSSNSVTKTWFDASYADQTAANVLDQGGTLSNPNGVTLIAMH